MSGTGITSGRKGPATVLNLPRVTDPVNAAQINTALAAIETYENQRAARIAQQIPTFSSLRIVASDGGTWQLTVTPTGAVYVSQVPRT